MRKKQTPTNFVTQQQLTLLRTGKGISHTHPNKDVLDQITAEMLAFWHYDAENKVVFLGDEENPVSLAAFGEVTAGGVGESPSPTPGVFTSIAYANLSALAVEEMDKVPTAWAAKKMLERIEALEQGGGGGGNVDDVYVNGVSALGEDKIARIAVPTTLAQLEGDSTHRLVTEEQMVAWDIAVISAHSHNNKEALDLIRYDARHNVVYLGDEDNPVSLAVFGEVTAGGIGSGGGGASSFAQLTGSPYDNVALSSALGQKYDASNPAGYITSSGSVAKVKGNNSSYDLYSLTYVAGHNYPYGERIYSDGFCVPNNAGILDGNIGVIRMGWEVAPYYHDILWSPNTSDIWHRNAATASSPWRKIWDSVNLTDNSQLTNGAGYATQTWVDSQIYLRKYRKDVDFNFEDGSDNQSGVYYCHSNYDQPNKPSTYGQILAINVDAGHFQLFNYESTLKFRGRWWSAAGHNWTDWKELIHSGNIANQSVAVLRDPDYHTYPGGRRPSANISWADGGLHYYLATSSMTEGKPSTDGHILHFSWDNSSWEAQLSIPADRNGSPQWRQQEGGAWSSWKTFYHSGNANNTSTPWSASTIDSNGVIYSNKYNATGNQPGAAFVMNKGGNWFGIGPSSGNKSNIGIGTTTNWTGDWLQELITIIDDGRVGIGTTSPSEKLYVSGNIVATGEITAGSDSRWKDNQTPVLNGIDIIRRLRPMSWIWNEQFADKNYIGKQSAGLIAQQVASVLPFAVRGNQENGYTLDYNVFHAYEISAIQYHETEIERLRIRVAQLERQLNIN